MSAFFFKKKDKPFNEDIFKKVQQILSKQLKEDETKITPDSRVIDDLGADSLDSMEIVLELEDAYNIEIFDEDMEKMLTVKDIVEHIEEQIQKKQTL